MLLTLAVSGHRSLRDLVLPLDRLNVVSGANGSGKSSLYKVIRLLATIEDAFPGSSVVIGISDSGFFEVQMRQAGAAQAADGGGVSDGTLRYLLLVAALLSPRPPSLLVLNEPETSLHPSLIAPLGRLIGRAAEQSQLIVITHSQALAEALAADRDAISFTLAKELGETVVLDDHPRPRWAWPSR